MRVGFFHVMNTSIYYFEIQFKDSTVVRWTNLSKYHARAMYRATESSMPPNTKFFAWGEMK